MFRLLRFIISCLMLSAFIWFAVTVPLGKHTLWGHVLRIARTEEARDLASGARDTATDVARRVQREMHPDGGSSDRPHGDHHKPTRH